MRRQPLTIALVAALFAFGAQAAPPKHKSRPAPSSSAAAAQSAPSSEDKARIAALMQYQRDLVTVSALRADAVHLIGAALLARPLPDQKPEFTFHRLAERAAAAPAAGPGITWIRLSDCDGSNCPNAEMLKQLQTQAADNAAVWMLMMDEAAQKNDESGARAALAKAAAAKSYDDYYGIGLQGVASVVGTLPPLPATMQGSQPGDPKTALGVELLIAFGVANQHPRPSLKPVLELCSADRAGKDAALKSDCLKTAHALEWGSSPIGRAVGLHIHGELDPSDKASTDKDARDLAWQMQNYGEIGYAALTDDRRAAPLLDAARSGGTELSLVLSTLRTNGVATEAPQGWQPEQPQAAPASSAGG